MDSRKKGCSFPDGYVHGDRVACRRACVTSRPTALPKCCSEILGQEIDGFELSVLVCDNPRTADKGVRIVDPSRLTSFP
jgi:hypothetical protein